MMLFAPAVRDAFKTTVVVASLFGACTSFAEDTADHAVADRVRSSLAVLLPDARPDSVNATPVPGLYEVMFGPRLIYMSGDGRYVLQGAMIDLEKRENLTEPRLAAAKKRAIEAIGEDNMLIYGDPKSAHTITVFTDIDCAYCRKFHGEMDKLNENGIRVRYLMYPRAGEGSPSYKKAVSAWCADDPHAALTAAKRGTEIPAKTCDNPIAGHLALGRSMGIQGTPSLVLENGDMLPGYVPANRLKAMLDQRREVAAK